MCAGAKMNKNNMREEEVITWTLDIRGSTAVAAMLPLCLLWPLVVRFFLAISGIIRRNTGETISFNGDGLTAVFPVSGPDGLPDRSLRAIVATVRVLRFLESWNRLAVLRGGGERHPLFSIRIGLDLGRIRIAPLNDPAFTHFTVGLPLCDWKMTMQSQRLVTFQKRKSANMWSEIALILILNALGFLIVLGNRYGRKPATVTLEDTDTGLQMSGEGIYMGVTDISQLTSMAASVVTGVNIWLLVGLWIIREVIVAIALS